MRGLISIGLVTALWLIAAWLLIHRRPLMNTPR